MLEEYHRTSGELLSEPSAGALAFLVSNRAKVAGLLTNRLADMLRSGQKNESLSLLSKSYSTTASLQLK